MNTRKMKQFYLVSSLAGVLLLFSGRSVQAEPQQVDATLIDGPQPIELTADEFDLDTEIAMGTVETTAASLQTEPLVDQTVSQIPDTSAEPTSPTVAQAITPGRATRSGASYIAVGGNIGFGGSTGLGRGNFAVTSKVGLTNNFSVRPGVLVGNRSTFLVPATLDFPIATVVDEGRVGLAPFVGGGVAVSTGNNSQVRPMITAGVDVPLTDRFTALASGNLGFFDSAEVGLILGVGYNF